MKENRHKACHIKKKGLSLFGEKKVSGTIKKALTNKILCVIIGLTKPLSA